MRKVKKKEGKEILNSIRSYYEKFLIGKIIIADQ